MKRLMSLIFAVCLLLTVALNTAIAKVPDVTVKINGVVQSFDVPPIIKNGRVLVPFRKIFESLGAQVTWDPNERAVHADKFGTQITLIIGQPTGYVITPTIGGGKNIENSHKLDVPPEIKNGRTLVPLRFVSESLGSKVEWVEKDRVVLITAAEPASFLPDKNLEHAIREMLGIKNGPLGTEDLKSLNQLMITSSAIDLTGLEHATNLKILSLSAKQVNHLEVLGSLSSLEDLNLYSVQNKDVRFLEKLLHLKSLRISEVPVEDISPVSKLGVLTSLAVTNAPVKDLRPLVGLSKLTSLTLESTQVADLSPLKNIKTLEYLSIYKAPMKDITPLQNLSLLSEVGLMETEVSDGTPLASLKNLKSLWLTDTKLTTIDFVTDLTNLEWLSVPRNQLQSLPSLKKLTKLATLHLDHNPLKDISPLAGLPALQKLSLSDTKVADLSPLATLPSLKEVYLFQIPVDWKTNAAALKVRQQLEQKGVEVSIN
ncbi:stalk domain-containing protein [Brevibacillus sp. NRS-1366]|uniref:stalk domain-containing protein n=1 Tax=Brevibacillus sp. NRS-1366 TaxID=3233899 RepID=UPI003D2319E4